MEKQQIDAELRNLSGGAQALHGNPPQRRCLILEPVFVCAKLKNRDFCVIFFRVSNFPS